MQNKCSWSANNLLSYNNILLSLGLHELFCFEIVFSLRSQIELISTDAQMGGGRSFVVRRKRGRQIVTCELTEIRNSKCYCEDVWIQARNQKKSPNPGGLYGWEEVHCMMTYSMVRNTMLSSRAINKNAYAGPHTAVAPSGHRRNLRFSSMQSSWPLPLW